MDHKTVKELTKASKKRHESYSKKWMQDHDVKAALRRREASPDGNKDGLKQALQRDQRFDI